MLKGQGLAQSAAAQGGSQTVKVEPKFRVQAMAVWDDVFASGVSRKSATAHTFR